MIEINDLCKSYFIKQKEIKALSKLNLHINEGEIFGLLGPNGAGKTTTIKILSTLTRPSSGTARVAGFDCVKQSILVRRNIGVVLSMTMIYHRLTGRANLRFFGKLYGVENLDKQIEKLADFFDMRDKLDLLVETYSTGMRAKLALMRGMIHDPPVLFFDEPTLGLDPTSAKKLRDKIIQLKKMKKTILLCTHHLSEADHLCDRIGILRKGELVAADTPANLRNRVGKQKSLEDVYHYYVGQK